jgi:LytS/YehU family sensor histidine kinase
MNPHFIFNSLNSIQYFILENDQVNAVNYLSTFSKLIRGILNNSISNKIRLTEELEQLNHYVSLELLRFENRFDFILQVDPDLDVEDIEIPSMLLQPYVENAILHGLYNKLNPGTLKVSVKEAGHSILFEIEDDGVGRAAAMNFRRHLYGHKSMGTALTEERLKLINAQSDASLKIIDLEREGKPAGTKVQIWIKE